jgi:signal transduction histidine kinase
VATDWRRYVRPQDLGWLLLFAAIAVFSPQRDAPLIILLVALGAVQVLERNMSPWAAIAIKLALCWGLILFGVATTPLAYENAEFEITSEYWIFLLLPVISAATSYGFLGSSLVTVLASLEYLSFLIFIGLRNQYLDYQHQLVLDGDNRLRLTLRVLAFFAVSYLTNQLAEDKRKESARYQEAAEELSAANLSLKEAEAQIRRTERLAALGQLTAGLAHELRNPMGTMKSSAELLARQIPAENEVGREMATYISSEVDRVNTIITRFLDFARPQHLKSAMGSLEQLLDQVIEHFERERTGAIAGVRVHKNYSPDVPLVPFDAQLMERVFSNLIVNAAQASPPDGVVTVTTRRAGPSAEIAVIDRGTGIDPKNLESIFNPFFTTKSEGVGLGLAIVSKIVADHGGRIEVESTVGEGTAFHVFLPVRPSTATQ